LSFIFDFFYKINRILVTTLGKINFLTVFYFFLFLVVFFINLNLLFTLKFESTALIFFFAVFVYLIYQYIIIYLLNYIDNEAFLIYLDILQKISDQKKKKFNRY